MTRPAPSLQSIIELSRLSALSRRGFLGGAAALGAVGALGASTTPAKASTTMSWMGWQGYETPITSGTFLKDNDIDFQPTFIASNEEIITKLQAGGIGKTDLITMYFGYLPIMAEGGLLEPIDPSKVAQFAISCRSSPRSRRSASRTSSTACRGTGVRCR